MSEPRQTGDPEPKSSYLSRFLATPGGRFVGIVVGVVVIVAIAIGLYILGRVGANNEIKADNNAIQEVQNEDQKLKADNAHQTATITDLGLQLKNAKDALEAILPTRNTYNINPNQALIVADGHLTIGLIGSPTNQSINININGKQQPAAAGDIIDVAADPSTNCQVKVQSFTMFLAVITASCQPAKAQ